MLKAKACESLLKQVEFAARICGLFIYHAEINPAV
jgi:hypothetical protein